MQAAAKGDAEALYQVGDCYLQGRGVFQSFPDAIVWLQRAAEAGHREAQYQLGLVLLRGAKAPLHPAMWAQTASRHNAEATEQNLKLFFPNGIDIEPNAPDALHWIRAAAEAGDSRAQALLATLLRQGQVCDQDYAEVITVFFNEKRRFPFRGAPLFLLNFTSCANRSSLFY